ncbi:hypothetical protein [Streptomyces shenzhenensis]|uniref:hypothetical protein n=1 Tax=Streptomyces shenzhenensis TaxID=943815 RepID=UPI0015F067A5|nr:hypothetical protein [Streptomyces shenzhenensis]
MKVEITVSAEEMPELIDLLIAKGAQITVHSSGAAAAERPVSLPPEIIEHLRTTASLDGRVLFTRFLEREVAERDASAELGTENTKYVKLYVPGPRKTGAYAYVTPYRGYIDFRLPASAVDGCAYAYLRDVRPGHAYPVRMPVNKPEALEEAHKLAHMAAEIASGI